MSEAFYTIPARCDAPVFIFGDHASKHIPAQFNGLGLMGDDLTRHIAWDIGTETLIQALCAHFGCAGHVASFSRLVIDANRDPQAAGLIPLESDGTIIPGNAMLSNEARMERVKTYYAPYHDGLAVALDGLAPQTLVISVHSFTPKPLTGEARQTDIGLLVKHDEASALRFQDCVKRLRPDFTVDINLPYSAYDLNYTIDHHVASHGFPHLAIEVRQDHVDTDDKARAVADMLAKAIASL